MPEMELVRFIWYYSVVTLIGLKKYFKENTTTGGIFLLFDQSDLLPRRSLELEQSLAVHSTESIRLLSTSLIVEI